jgi:hypothetical protein
MKPKRVSKERQHRQSPEHFTLRKPRDLSKTAVEAITDFFLKRPMATLEEVAYQTGYTEATVVATLHMLKRHNPKGYVPGKVWVREEGEAYGRFYYFIA